MFKQALGVIIIVFAATSLASPTPSKVTGIGKNVCYEPVEDCLESVAQERARYDAVDQCSSPVKQVTPFKMTSLYKAFVSLTIFAIADFECEGQTARELDGNAYNE